MGILRADRVSHSSLEPTGSVLFDGTTDMLTIPSHSALAFGTADWSVEGWFYFTDLTGQQTIVGDTYGATAGWYLYKQSNNRLGVYYSSLIVDGVTELEANRWYHLAFIRNSGVTSIYIDGVLDKSATDTTDATITQYYIADTAGTSSGEFFGYISNLRITRTAVYKQNFTVPKFELKNIPGTILLCCQSSSSTTESAVSVPGTLTAQGDPTATSFAPDLKEDITDIGPVFGENTVFDTISYMVPPGGTTAQSNRGRGVFGGGYTSSPAGASVKRMYYIQIDSMGTSGEFGDMHKVAAYGQGGCSSSTRGLFTGGTNPTNLQDIDYITIATTSNGLDFGDLRIQHGYTSSCSNETRGLTGGGRGVGGNEEIDYVTIATTGNGQDFGDLTGDRMGLGAFENSTRGYFSGGDSNPVTPAVVYKNIDTVLFATTGNATDFGDMTDEHVFHGTASSSTRGIMYGGVTSYGPTVTTNIIEYVTTSSTGSGTDFGDVRDDGEHAHGTSNSIRGVFAGGVNPYRNSIDFITITTTGNGVDWGDLPIASGSYAYAAGLSDSHGGIS